MRVWAGPSPHSPVAGEDLVLHADLVDVSRYPLGTLLDDWLEQADRVELDREANAALARWRAETSAMLHADESSLGHLFEGELYADVFLRERFALTGLERAFDSSPPATVALRRADPELHAAVSAVLGTRGIRTELGETAAPPSYPLAFASSAGLRRPVAAAARELLGLPAMVRGDVLLFPTPVLAPLWTGLRAAGVRPAVDFFNRPGLSLSAAFGGGWIAHPGRRLRRSARTLVTRALDDVEQPEQPEAEPLAWLERRRAKRLLAARGPEVIASQLALRRTLSRSGMRAIVVPSDGTASGRAVLAAAAREGVAVTQVQHGFFSDLWHLGDGLAPYVDGLTAPRAAVWSEPQRSLIAPAAAGRVEVTGNPAAAALMTRRPRAPGDGPLLVLLQAPPLGTPVIERRAPSRYLQAALEGIDSTWADKTVMLRPHPLDPADYSPAATGHVTNAPRGPLEPLLERASLCVGPVSTGTLTAAAMGVPTVHLDVAGPAFPKPFADHGGIRRATSGEDLAAALAEIEPGDGAEAAREALGTREDAVERVLDLAL